MALEDAENSDDEQNIRRAEQRALEKRDSKKNKYQNQNRVRPVSSVFTNHGQRLPTFRPFRPYGSGPETATQQIGSFQRFNCHWCGLSGHWKQSVPKGKRKSDRDATHTSQEPYNRITERHLKETSLETRNKERKDLEVKYRKISSFSSECPDVETDIFLENQSWDKDDESCEYEQSTDSVFVKGPVRTNLDYWKEIGTSYYILDAVQNGYRLLFKTIPKKAEFKNNKSALNNEDFVTSSNSIDELVKSNRVVKVPFKPHMINPLSESSNKGKRRLTLDLG